MPKITLPIIRGTTMQQVANNAWDNMLSSLPENCRIVTIKIDYDHDIMKVVYHKDDDPTQELLAQEKVGIFHREHFHAK